MFFTKIQQSQKETKIRKEKKEKGSLPKSDILMSKIIEGLSLSQDRYGSASLVLGLTVGEFLCSGRAEEPGVCYNSQPL